MKKEVFAEYLSKSEAERQEAIDTGLFNSIIEAYMLNAMMELNYSFSQMQEATEALRGTLNGVSAAEAVSRAAVIKNLFGSRQ